MPNVQSPAVARLHRASHVLLRVLLLGLLLLAVPAWALDRVNINTADAETLAATLQHVGPVKAKAIVDYRREYGSFRSVEQLAMVKGVGLKTVERNRDRILLDSGEEAARGGVVSGAGAGRSGRR